MSRLRQTFDIARWEFMRFFKPRDVILTIVIMVGVTGAAYGFSYWQKQSEPVIELAVISPADLPLTDPTFAVTHHPAEREAQLRAQVAAKELDGLLIVASSPAQTALVVRKSPAWIDRLNTALTGIAREQRLHQLGIDQTQLAAALAPVAVTVELTAGASDAGHQRGLAAILVGLMLLSLFLSLSYLFMGITGEKQQRATEQLFSITSAQAIIDGKLLGIAAVAVLYTVQLAGLGLVLYEVVSGGAVDWLLASLADIEVFQVVVSLVFAGAGFAFWMSTCAALFATIEDPHSSARSNVLMLPLLPLAAAFTGFSSPDSVMMHVLSWLPITSMTVVPLRVVMTEVALWQVAGSLLVLVAATWLARRGAGRLYGAAMLMYGKEPGMGEMLRWLRAPRGSDTAIG